MMSERFVISFKMFNIVELITKDEIIKELELNFGKFLPLRLKVPKILFGTAALNRQRIVNYRSKVSINCSF
jgi:hypothetical protein